jgi:predicted PilT family ATPase
MQGRSIQDIHRTHAYF